jgi:hypothetical protein
VTLHTPTRPAGENFLLTCIIDYDKLKNYFLTKRRFCFIIVIIEVIQRGAKAAEHLAPPTKTLPVAADSFAGNV